MPHVLPVLSSDDAVADIADGMTILIGGVAGGGAPFELVRALNRQGARHLTIVTNNVSIQDNNDLLVESGQVSRVISSFPVPASLKTVTAVERRFNEGDLAVETVPQGTLIERLRAAGSGIGAMYLPTGVGTVVEDGKEVRLIDGIPHLLEYPSRGDVSLIRAYKADEMGNLVYRGTARNFNPAMAMAARLTIVQVEEIVPTGSLDPETIVTPGIFVHRLCLVSERE